jgi:hypothetical protein
VRNIQQYHVHGDNSELLVLPRPFVGYMVGIGAVVGLLGNGRSCSVRGVEYREGCMCPSFNIIIFALEARLIQV